MPGTWLFCANSCEVHRILTPRFQLLRNKGIQGVRARYDADFLPLISIVESCSGISVWNFWRCRDAAMHPHPNPQSQASRYANADLYLRHMLSARNLAGRFYQLQLRLGGCMIDLQFVCPTRICPDILPPIYLLVTGQQMSTEISPPLSQKCITKIHADLVFQACISFLSCFRTPGAPIRKS